MCIRDSYAASAEMASELDPFPGYERNKDGMLRVLRNHRRAAYRASDREYEGLTIKPVAMTVSIVPLSCCKQHKLTRIEL